MIIESERENNTVVALVLSCRFCKKVVYFALRIGQLLVCGSGGFLVTMTALSVYMDF